AEPPTVGGADPSRRARPGADEDRTTGPPRSGRGPADGPAPGRPTTGRRPDGPPPAALPPFPQDPGLFRLGRTQHADGTRRIADGRRTGTWQTASPSSPG